MAVSRAADQDAAQLPALHRDLIGFQCHPSWQVALRCSTQRGALSWTPSGARLWWRQHLHPVVHRKRWQIERSRHARLGECKARCCKGFSSLPAALNDARFCATHIAQIRGRQRTPPCQLKLIAQSLAGVGGADVLNQIFKLEGHQLIGFFVKRCR